MLLFDIYNSTFHKQIAVHIFENNVYFHMYILMYILCVFEFTLLLSLLIDMYSAIAAFVN